MAQTSITLPENCLQDNIFALLWAEVVSAYEDMQEDPSERCRLIYKAHMAAWSKHFAETREVQ